MLEHRCQADAERFKQLEAQLKEARNTADDSDRKYDSVSVCLLSVLGMIEFVFASKTAWNAPYSTAVTAANWAS